MANNVRFRPTLRTGLLLVTVLILSLVSVFVLNRAGGRKPTDTAAATAPPEASPLQVRAMRQLAARTGRPTVLEYSVAGRTAGALCGYASLQRPMDGDTVQRRPLRVFAFVSLPDRAVTGQDADFRQVAAANCPPIGPAPPSADR